MCFFIVGESVYLFYFFFFQAEDGIRDGHVTGVQTCALPISWREIQWAQRAVAADGHRIESPLLFLLPGEDRLVDAHLARAFADSLKGAVRVRWYPEMYHEVLHDPQRDEPYGDIIGFLAGKL